MSEKAATTKRFEFSPLVSELTKQSSIGEKQYKRLGKAYELDKDEYKTKKKEKPVLKMYNISHLVYDGRYSLYE